MTLILSNALENTDHFHSIYMDDDNLVLEGPGTTIVTITDVPSDALAKIAVAAAEGRSFVEFENAKLVITEAEDEA